MNATQEKADILKTLREAMHLAEEGCEAGPRRGEGELALGISALDRALQGGLARGALHEIAPSGPLHMGAAAGFALALAGLAQQGRRQMLWIQQDFAALEGGEIYAPGLALYGLAVEQFLLLRVAKPMEALWAMEEALSSQAFASLVMELASGSDADLTATRRLQLAAREGDTLALLLRQQKSGQASAATTRWEISALPGLPDELGGLGKPRFGLNLTRNRRGPCGSWAVTWDRQKGCFFSDALSLTLVSTPSNRSDAAPARRAV